MKRLWILSLALVAVLLPLAAQSAPSGKVKQTRSPIATLALDGPRVAYASGDRVYVWNLLTGATSQMRGSYGKHTSEVAIAGTRVAWITRHVAGNSYETREYLYAAPVGSRSKLLAAGRRYLSSPDEASAAWYGRWIAGAVGSGKTLAVSTWWSPGDGTCIGQRLSRMTPTGLAQVAVGPGTILSESADSGRIAVLRSEDAWPIYGMATALEAPASIGIYSASGTLLREIAPSSAEMIALGGNTLAVLTETRMIEVYDWKSGTLLHTWPAAGTGKQRQQPRSLAVYGQLAVYSIYSYGSNRTLHVLRLTTGKDVVLARGRGTGDYERDSAIGPRGLVYFVNYHEHGRLSEPMRGKLVFVPLARVLEKVR